jgi:hypothetical protein
VADEASAGEVKLVLREVVAFIPEWNGDDENDPTIMSVRPLVANWDGTEHPQQMILRPDGLFVDRRNMIVDREAAIALFREHRRLRRPTQRPGHRVCRYRPASLLDRDRD